jgi:rhamnulose-1-phosphate aldolase
MRLLDLMFVKEFLQLCDEGYHRNWHERNGGNLSYRLAPEEVEQIQNDISGTNENMPTGVHVPDLAGEYFLITGSGKYFRDMSRNPQGNLALIEICASGREYRIVWGLGTGELPTSELPTHLLNHEVKMKMTAGRHRIIYHFHPTNLIALTFMLPLNDRVFSRELWSMVTECPFIFPAGVGVLEWMMPGRMEIATATAEKIKRFDLVIWAHHGALCSGADFNSVWGLAQAAEKAAEILVKIMAVQGGRRRTITSRNIRDLARSFNLPVTEEFLDDD